MLKRLMKLFSKPVKNIEPVRTCGFFLMTERHRQLEIEAKERAVAQQGEASKK